MGEPAPADGYVDAQVHARHRRTYQLLLVIAICLAVIGSPMLMEGAVALAKGITQDPSQPHAAAYGLFRFALGAAPMVLAGYTWGKVKGLERLLEQEEQRSNASHR
jgi:hypothetical protein